eukprot:g67.t1
MMSCFDQTSKATPCSHQQCHKCPAGHYSTERSRPNACPGRCAAGRWGGKGQTDALCEGSCRDGHWSKGGATDPECSGACPAGKFWRNALCAACPAGKYTRRQAQLRCRNCAVGHTSKSDATQCRLCHAGRIAKAGAAACEGCSNGFYAATEGMDECTPCTPGQYSHYNYLGTSSCSACAPGRYALAGAGTCAACAAGRFSTSSGDSCKDCAAGRWSGAGAAGSVCATPCARGRFNTGPRGSSAAGAFAAKGAAAPSHCPMACPAGTVGPAGSGSGSRCKACPAGRWTKAGGATCTYQRATLAPFYEEGKKAAGLRTPTPAPPRNGGAGQAKSAQPWWAAAIPTPSPTPAAAGSGAAGAVATSSVNTACEVVQLLGVGRHQWGALRGCGGRWRAVESGNGCAARHAAHCTRGTEYKLERGGGGADGDGDGTGGTFNPEHPDSSRRHRAQPARHARCGPLPDAWLFYDPGFGMWVVSNNLGLPPFLLAAKGAPTAPSELRDGAWQTRGAAGEFTAAPRRARAAAVAALQNNPVFER